MKYILLILLFIVAVIERTFFDLGPNIELVTTAMLIANFYLGHKEGFWLTFFIIAVSDIVLGNSSIFLFTWSGFLLPALILGNMVKKNSFSGISRIFAGSLSGIFSTSFFFLWTNFGVWALDSWNMYPNTLFGLMQSYINGLPFLKYQALSTLLFVPTGFVLCESVFSANKVFKKNLQPGV